MSRRNKLNIPISKLDKIDVVYLWVDPSDKQWQQLREKYAPPPVINHNDDGNDNSRFRDNGEFLYSMRSLAENAPWVNHIYIITGFGHVPKWLNTKHAKITIVDHSEILPADALPTFSSSAIEMGIPNIPGLGERFLLMNDDTFINRPLTPNFFYDKDGRARLRYSRVYYSPDNIEKLDSYTRNIINCAELIDREYNCKLYDMRPSHGIDPYIKSSWQHMLKNKTIAQKISETAHNKFRKHTDLLRWIVSLYDIVIGWSVPVHSRARKHNRHKVSNFIYNILYRRSTRNSPVCCSDAYIARHAIANAPIFCLNDTPDNDMQRLRHNAEFLAHRFPNKCEFEK